MSDTTTARSGLDDVLQTSRPLVVGYGNPLRCDDAIGWRAALALADDPRLAGVDVLARHQLTPELAVDVAAALLGLSADLYGAAPPALLVTAPAESLEVSEELSVEGERMLGIVIETVVGLLHQQEGAGNA